MAEDVFDPMEIAEVAAFCDEAPVERRWARRRGTGGEDVIEIAVEGQRPGLLRLKKTNGAYAVTGLGGWGLAVFEDLSSMIRTIANKLLHPARQKRFVLEQR